MTSLQQKLQDTQLSEDALRPGPAGQCVMQACGGFGCLPRAGSRGNSLLWEGLPVQLAPTEGLRHLAFSDPSN